MAAAPLKVVGALLLESGCKGLSSFSLLSAALSIFSLLALRLCRGTLKVKELLGELVDVLLLLVPRDIFFPWNR